MLRDRDDVAAGRTGEAACERQAEPGAACVADARFEDTLGGVRWDAGPVVDDGDDDAGIVTREADLDGADGMTDGVLEQRLEGAGDDVLADADGQRLLLGVHAGTVCAGGPPGGGNGVGGAPDRVAA